MQLYTYIGIHIYRHSLVDWAYQVLHTYIQVYAHTLYECSYTHTLVYMYLSQPCQALPVFLCLSAAQRCLEDTVLAKEEATALPLTPYLVKHTQPCIYIWYMYIHVPVAHLSVKTHLHCICLQLMSASNMLYQQSTYHIQRDTDLYMEIMCIAH